jgi:hypothetical protein
MKKVSSPYRNNCITFPFQPASLLETITGSRTASTGTITGSSGRPRLPVQGRTITGSSTGTHYRIKSGNHYRFKSWPHNGLARHRFHQTLDAYA